MPLADVAYVKLVGGLNEAQDYLLFRVADTAAMDAKLQEDLNLASAFIGDRVPVAYYTGSPTVNVNRDLLFKRAEALFALAFAGINPKTRKVVGTHANFDSEGSERYAELVDNEYLKQAELLIEPYVSITEVGEPSLALPTLLVTPAIAPADVQTTEEVLEDDILASLGAVPFGSPR